MTVKTTTRLDASAPQVWAAAKKPATLRYVARGMLGFSAERFADEWRAGETVTTRLYLFGLFPAWKHRLEIVRVDDARRELFTNERGGFVSEWNHRISVAPAGDKRCSYTDEIEINAGLLTVFVWFFAHVFYHYRQRRWRKFVSSGLTT